MASCRLASARVSWIFRSNSTDMELAARQNLGQVHGAQVQARARKSSLNLHQATRVQRHHGVGAGAHDGFDLSARHGARKLRELNREGAAEPAALFGRNHLAQLQSLYVSQQAARRRLDAEFAESVAAIVKGHNVVRSEERRVGKECR